MERFVCVFRFISPKGIGKINEIIISSKMNEWWKTDATFSRWFITNYINVFFFVVKIVALFDGWCCFLMRIFIPPPGTRIIYNREFLMNLRSSPYAKSPPKMCFVPGVTNIPASKVPEVKSNKNDTKSKFLKIFSNCW